jgi:hypothetical protein
LRTGLCRHLFPGSYRKLAAGIWAVASTKGRHVNEEEEPSLHERSCWSALLGPSAHFSSTSWTATSVSGLGFGSNSISKNMSAYEFAENTIAAIYSGPAPRRWTAGGRRRGRRPVEPRRRHAAGAERVCLVVMLR